MLIHLLALAHAYAPLCTPASDECLIDGCVYVATENSPACVDWDLPSGVLVVMPGAQVDVVVSEPWVHLENVYVGFDLDDLPPIVQLALVGLPAVGSGDTRLTLDAAGNELYIGETTRGLLHPVHVQDATVELIGATVVGNSSISCIHASADSTVDLQGGTVMACYNDGGQGGGIFAEGSSVIATGTEFFYNGAGTGGDVYVRDGSLTLLDTRHVDFYASIDGGSVAFQGDDLTVDGSSFTNGGANGKGGAILVGDDATGDAHVVRADVLQTWASYGGAIALYGGSAADSLVVEDSTFDQTSATEGGAIYLGADNELTTLAHLTVSMAFADFGGGVAAYSDLEVKSSQFQETEGWSFGGAIAADGDVDLTVANSGFLLTNAIYGGALYLDQVDALAITGSWFCETRAWGAGGAVALGQANAPVEVRHSLFQFVDSPSGAVWSQTGDTQVSLDHIAAVDLPRGPLDANAGTIIVTASVLEGGGWAGTGPDNAVFTGAVAPELFFGAPTPCGAPFQLHPVNEPAQERFEAVYATSGVWSLEGNHGPFGFEGDVPETTEGLLDPQYVLAWEDASGSRDEAAEWYHDSDGDGFPSVLDCDDGEPTIHPAALERCFDSIDNDCDGLVDGDDEKLEVYFVDADQDGSVADGAEPFTDCEGFAELLVAASDAKDGLDCNDQDPTIYEGAPERCDGLDNDCDGGIDTFVEGTIAADDVPLWYRDPDQDGWADEADAVPWCGDDKEAADEGLVPADRLGDCEPDDALVNPGTPERCNGIDDDCDGSIDIAVGQIWYADPDGDGHVSPDAEAEEGCVPEGLPAVGADQVLGEDCDEQDPLVNSSAPEVCGDGVDNDCDPATGDLLGAQLYYPDSDGDGHGDEEAEGSLRCPQEATEELSLTADDCNDEDIAVHPGAEEVMDNGVDDDCSGGDMRSYAVGGCGSCNAGRVRIELLQILARRR